MQRLCSLSRLRVQRRNGSSVQRSRFDDRGRVVLRKGSVVCNSSQPARDLYAVRSGALKECTIDRAGKERVIEFYFPGETVGLYALSQHTYRYCAISIEKSTVCRIPFDSLLERIKHMPRLQQNLLN